MYRTIVVGTDGSGPANAAVHAAAEVAERFDDAEVHVVAGYRPVSPAELNRRVRQMPDEYLETVSPDAPGAGLVDEASEVLRSRHVDVHGHAVPSNGAEAILDVAEQVGADLIVVGSHGHGMGHRFLHGSVSDKVAHHAPCSVMIVHVPDTEK